MRVGIIGDLHIPYHHPGYLKFCKKIFKENRVNKVIMIGDLIDHHAMSFHESEPSLKGITGEMIDARQALKPWYKAFPKLTITFGNHDKIPARQLKHLGIDSEVWMRPLNEVYSFPKGWKLVQEIMIDGVLFHHGDTALGANGFRNDARDRMVSTVTGHAHGNAGISATACEHRLVWGMAVGCGIDVKSMAFVYGKNFKSKPIVSCGTVIDGKPQIHYMDLGEGP